ncbi:MAG: glycosyltransferase [Bacteroidales bacterium]|nr:glycosyltransferase [Bacteroidales bacterium]
MTLSIVIVNYNVRFFLEQCLESVYNSRRDCETGQLELEVFVVDNDSADDSVKMVRERFPQVKLIENKENVGFAKANNQALRECKGEYVLLLNPDTLVEHDTFVRCVDFIASHHDCGALGVKMVDGNGRFLKESKRGFPTPAASFYKLSGLIKLFPHSRRIAAYYMGHIPNDQTAQIEILPGAFIMTTRAALDKVGLLDESYFMYGEDIDFSWRFILAGYKNYYLPEARIIHYKGESTKKGSMNYVYTFYNAMSIFSKRYFKGSHAAMYNLLIHLAIWLRAGLSFMRRLVSRIVLPLADFAMAFGGFVLIKDLWAKHLANTVNYYPAEYTYAVLPTYIAVLMLSTWLNGGYDKPLKHWRIVKGMAIGATVLLVFYSLLDETQRYSRAILLLGAIWTTLTTIGLRVLLTVLGAEGYQSRRKRTAIVIGSESECRRAEKLYNESGQAGKKIVRLEPDGTRHLNELIHIHHADEVVFCGRDLSTADIINLMSQKATHNVDYKIVPSESDFVIGSNSISSPEDLYTEELNAITTPMNRRNKRLFDISSATLLLLLSPILFWFQKRKRAFYINLLNVLVGRKTWVGDKGIFSPADIVSNGNAIDRKQIELRYSRNYHLSTDIIILWKNLLNI